MKKILILIPVILVMIFISEFINNETTNETTNEKEIKKEIKKDDEQQFFIKNIAYENLTIKLNKDLKSGEIISDGYNYKLKSNDIKIDGNEIEIFYDLKKKIFYLNKEELNSN